MKITIWFKNRIPSPLTVENVELIDINNIKTLLVWNGSPADAPQQFRLEEINDIRIIPQ